MSIAADISAQYNDDGQCWTDSNGVKFHATAERLADWRGSYDTATSHPGVTIYLYSDGSGLVACEGYWDILTRSEGTTSRTDELLAELETRGGSVAAPVVATWTDGGGEVWAYEDAEGDLMGPATGDWI